MKFITFQSIFENTDPINNPSVKRQEDLNGIRPMWVVPITTYEETMARILTIAPNIPVGMLIVESNDFIKINKISHYKNISDHGNRDVLNTEGLPEDQLEYCIDRDSDDVLIHMMAITGVALNMRLGQNILNTPWLKVVGADIPQVQMNDINTTISEVLLKVPLMEGITEDQYNNLQHKLGSLEHHSDLLQGYRLFNYSITPMLVKAIIDMETEKDHKMIVSTLPAFATTQKANTLDRLSNKFANWSYGDCDTDEYNEIMTEMQEVLSYDEDVAAYIANYGKPGRNEKCPCGSGKKYKKCHYQ